MALAVTIIALVVVAGALAVVSFKFASYRHAHPYGRDDLDRERRDAIKRSDSTLDGKAVEQLAPFLAEFCDRFDANEARFLGSPIDYIVFDGLRHGRLQRVVFLDIKTGGSAALSREQRQIRNAVNAGHIEFDTLRVDRPAARTSRPPTSDPVRADLSRDQPPTE